jgi:predicted AAA+ superfamily ATPase
VSVNREKFSFPVGKIEFMTMYPLDFEEYLMAINEDKLIELIYESYNNNKPLDALFHERALNYYKEYLFVGGMPEVVEEYNKNHNFELVKILQQTILESYHNDMGKYNKQTEIPKTRIVYKKI